MSETIKNDPANYLTRDKIAAHNAREAAVARPPQPEDTRPRFPRDQAFINEHNWIDFTKPKDWEPDPVEEAPKQSAHDSILTPEFRASVAEINKAVQIDPTRTISILEVAETLERDGKIQVRIAGEIVWITEQLFGADAAAIAAERLAASVMEHSAMECMTQSVPPRDDPE